MGNIPVPVTGYEVCHEKGCLLRRGIIGKKIDELQNQAKEAVIKEGPFKSKLAKVNFQMKQMSVSFMADIYTVFGHEVPLIKKVGMQLPASQQQSANCNPYTFEVAMFKSFVSKFCIISSTVLFIAGTTSIVEHL